MARKYDSALRAEQADATRGRILAALAAQLVEGAGQVSLPRVAELAGVSLRTLHNHFPDEQARNAALARWIDERVGVADDAPVTLDDIPAYASRMVRAFFANDTLLRAQLAVGASDVRRERRRGRERRLRTVIGDVVADPNAADMVAAILAWVVGGHTSIALKDHTGLAESEVEKAMVWAARVLADAARRGDLP